MCFVLKGHQDKVVIGINEVCGRFLLLNCQKNNWPALISVLGLAMAIGCCMVLYTRVFWIYNSFQREQIFEKSSGVFER